MRLNRQRIRIVPLQRAGFSTLTGYWRGTRRRVTRHRAGIVAVLLLLPSAAAAASSQLEFIGASARLTATHVTMRLSSAATYQVRTLDAHDGHPYRIYIDFDGTTLDKGTDPQRPLSAGPVMRIRTGQFTPSQARVVLDLKHPAPYTVAVRQKPFRIIVSVDDPLSVDDPPSAEDQSLSTLEPPATVATVTPQPEPEPRLEQPSTVEADPRPEPPAEREPQAVAVAAVTPEPEPELRLEQPSTPGADPRPEPPAARQPQQLNEPDEPQTAERNESSEPQTEEPQISAHDASDAPLWEVSPAHILTGPAFAAPLRIVIDPGHGGRDPGARSADGTWEKNIALGVAHELAHRLRDRLGVEVVLTRDGDQTLSIAERALYAENASLFLSVHANTCPEQWVGGVQTFYADDADNGSASRRLALLVHHRVVDAIAGGYGPVHDGGVRPRELGVLVRSAAPSVLLEAAYLSNPTDRRRLADPAYRQAVVDGTVDGIADYLSGVREPLSVMARR
jgi:N-acetylmuramoyl-L-alanine amidase